MFCWKKASCNVQNKEKSKSKEENKKPVLKRNTKLNSFRKKDSTDKKNSLTLRFNSKLEAKK